MIRLAGLFVFGMAMAMPSFATAQDAEPAAAVASDCGGCNSCAATPCCRTRLKLQRVCKEVTRCKRVCSVDECGCRTYKRVRVTKTVTRLQFVRVPREPRQRCCRPARTTGCCN